MGFCIAIFGFLSTFGVVCLNVVEPSESSELSALTDFVDRFVVVVELSVGSFKPSSVKMSLKLRIEKMSLKLVAGVVRPSFWIDTLKLPFEVIVELSKEVVVEKEPA